MRNPFDDLIPGQSAQQPTSQQPLIQARPRQPALRTPAQQAADEGAAAAAPYAAPQAQATLRRTEQEVAQEDERQQARAGALAARVRGMDHVISAIDDARNNVSGWSSGFVGQRLSGVGGTQAHDLTANLDTVVARIGFDELQRMRQESPTGGALGQVSDFENRNLQAAIASLRNSQSSDQLLRNLDRVELHYLNVMRTAQGQMPFRDLEEGRRAHRAGFTGTPGQTVELQLPEGAPPAPLTDDERRLIQEAARTASTPQELDAAIRRITGGRIGGGPNSQEVIDFRNRTGGAVGEVQQPSLGSRLWDATANTAAGIGQGLAAIPDAATNALGAVLGTATDIIPGVPEWVSDELRNPATIGGAIERVSPTPDSPGAGVARFGGQMLGGYASLPARAQSAIVSQVTRRPPPPAPPQGSAPPRSRRAARREVPTSDQLRQQASALYTQAESRGVVAGAEVTTRIADRTRRIARSNELITPAGRVSSAYPRAADALQLLDDYAGHPMNPTQIQVIRENLADAVQATDGKERRIARMMLQEFDRNTVRLAPELGQARSVASRYLQADRIRQARDLAEARAAQFSGSGMENALRTEFRNLDRRVVRGQERFNPDVEHAVRGVARGTRASNAARAVGRLAPTGVVSAGLGGGVPFGIGTAIGGPGLGGVLAGSAMALGAGGRALATRQTRNAAEMAELVARNGGRLGTAQAPGSGSLLAPRMTVPPVANDWYSEWLRRIAEVSPATRAAAQGNEYQR